MFQNKKWYSVLLAGAVALTLALGVMAFAPTLDASAASAVDTDLFHGRGPAGRGGESPLGGNEDLADALGISVEDLQAANETAQAAALAQAVEAGLITQEQADQVSKRGFSGRRGIGSPGGEIDYEALLADALGISVEALQAARETAMDARLSQAIEDGKLTEEDASRIEARQALRNYFEKDEMLAKALGISVEELDAAREDGTRIPDLLEELGLTEEEFQANMQTVRQEMLQQAVEDGLITQEQADLLLEGDFGGRMVPGGHRCPGRGGALGGMENFEGRDGFPGRVSPEGSDGINFQLPDAPVNEG